MNTEFGSLPTLETVRLRLRPLTIDDAGDIFAYAADSQVTKYLMWSPHRSIDDSLVFINAAIGRYKKRQPAPWAMELKSEQKVIGTCDYISWSPDHGRTEIGYAMAREYWGRGLMTEAVREIIEYGFRDTGINRIQALCEIPNIGSARVMEKVGMLYEGILRDYMIQHGAFRDMKIYAILRKDWEGQQISPSE
jgi:ribosomal-protein-alanine N-acetyltransferase